MTIKLARRTLTRLALAWTVGLALSAAGCKKKSSSDDDDDDDDNDDNDDSSKKKKKKKKDKGKLSDEVMRDKPTAGKTFTGAWQTAWGKVTLVQAGEKISGAFSGKFTGTLDGVVIGNQATLTWAQTNGERGKAKY
ncbi:MAG: hypothetical protein JRI68_35865, partial [Deltaproteobacteria bacterium]|nr:hypothetical protein [Deltaproteobacteria bacterium]